MTDRQVFMTIILIAAATLLTRALPFLIFPSKEKPHDFIVYLGRVLPPASLGLLLVYCLKDSLMASLSNPLEPAGLSAHIATAVTAILQLVKKSSIISILGGTASFIVLQRLLG